MLWHCCHKAEKFRCLAWVDFSVSVEGIPACCVLEFWSSSSKKLAFKFLGCCWVKTINGMKEHTPVALLWRLLAPFTQNAECFSTWWETLWFQRINERSSAFVDTLKKVNSKVHNIAVLWDVFWNVKKKPLMGSHREEVTCGRTGDVKNLKKRTTKIVVWHSWDIQRWRDSLGVRLGV